MADDLPYLERVKIQAEILVPLFRRLRAELGEARAAELVSEAVREYATGLGEAVAARTPGTALERLQALVPSFTAGDALDLEPLKSSDRALEFNVRGCRYAEYFHAIGEPLLGALMTCGIDPPLTAALGDDLELERSQTLMQGASHCDFRWRLRGGG